MADFELTKTNYEDFYLSNFFGKRNSKDNVEVEVIGVEDNSFQQNEEVVTDSKLIAIISAAIAVATEQEQAERKVTFKVRSIKHIN